MTTLSESDTAVEVRALGKRFPAASRFRAWVTRAPSEEREALVDVSFDVRAGEVVGLIGPNGAGKSTLLRILAGLLLPSTGKARVAGLDVVADRPRSRLGIGAAVSEDRGLSPRLTARENLRFFGALFGLDRRATDARMDALAARFEASHLLTRPVRTLSTGERARLVLVRAMLHAPRVLLLDELTRSLDPGAAHRLRRLLLEDVTRSRAAVLFASHDLAEVESLSARTVLLDRGRVAAFAPYPEVAARAREVFARATG